MVKLEESRLINGLYLVQLHTFADERGKFTEIFRKEWFPDRDWGNIQSNRSESAANVLRGLHYHHNQVDYWHIVSGYVRAALVDLRRSSPTRGVVQTVDLNQERNLGLYIPTGVAHGFVVFSKATLIYIVDNYYDGEDEFGVAWNDPDLDIDWGITSPILSKRDNQNPVLKQIPEEALPR
jgi:dTDP-4-dehydrorhamnose 3,5-epimerase